MQISGNEKCVQTADMEPGQI